MIWVQNAAAESDDPRVLGIVVEWLPSAHDEGGPELAALAEQTDRQRNKIKPRGDIQ